MVWPTHTLRKYELKASAIETKKHDFGKMNKNEKIAVTAACWLLLQLNRHKRRKITEVESNPKKFRPNLEEFEEVDSDSDDFLSSEDFTDDEFDELETINESLKN